MKTLETSPAARQRLENQSRQYIEGLTETEPALAEMIEELLSQLDESTRTHSLRVGALTLNVKNYLERSVGKHAEVSGVVEGGLVHDVGKMTPEVAAILPIARPLNPEEKAVLETHTSVGWEITEEYLRRYNLAGKGIASTMLDIVSGHHHPRELLGKRPDRAPVQLVQIVDMVDATLDPDRPYVLADVRPIDGRSVHPTEANITIEPSVFLSALIREEQLSPAYARSASELGALVVADLHDIPHEQFEAA